MNINFNANKTYIEAFKEWSFRGDYFRNIYSGINVKWYRKSWKEFHELRINENKYYCSNYYNISINK